MYFMVRQCCCRRGDWCTRTTVPLPLACVVADPGVRNFLLTGPHANYPFVLSAHLRQRLLHANMCLRNMAACDRLHRESGLQRSPSVSAAAASRATSPSAALFSKAPTLSTSPMQPLAIPDIAAEPARFPAAITTEEFARVAQEISGRLAVGTPAAPPGTPGHPQLLPQQSFYGASTPLKGAPPPMPLKQVSPQSQAEAAAAAASAARDWASQLSEGLSELQVWRLTS